MNLANRSGNNGVELDYTAVSAQNRQAFVDLVTAVAAELHKDHHELIVELPAPTLVGSGWNTGAYDWSSIAKNADYVKLLPALDESVYRKQMPDLLQFLTSNAGVDTTKLVLVTSPYTVEKTDVNTQVMTRLSALSIASQIQIPNRGQAAAGSNVTLLAANLDHDSGGSGLIWDSATATVSFVYKVGDATHVVWIANQFSEGFKLEYAQIYHLGGIAVDDSSNDPALGDVWPAVTQFVATGTPELQQPNPGMLVPTWLVDSNPLTTDGKTVFSWSAPSQPGDHTVSLIVSDGDVRVVGSTQVTLRANPTASAGAAAGSSVPATATPRAAPLTATPSLRTPVVTSVLAIRPRTSAGHQRRSARPPAPRAARPRHEADVRPAARGRLFYACLDARVSPIRARSLCRYRGTGHRGVEPWCRVGRLRRPRAFCLHRDSG